MSSLKQGLVISTLALTTISYASMLSRPARIYPVIKDTLVNEQLCKVTIESMETTLDGFKHRAFATCNKSDDNCFAKIEREASKINNEIWQANMNTPLNKDQLADCMAMID